MEYWVDEKHLYTKEELDEYRERAGIDLEDFLVQVEIKGISKKRLYYFFIQK